MNKPVRILLIIIFFFFLILIRAYAPRLFYDPFIAYFKNDYLYKSIPQISFFKFFLNLAFRYSLNAILSVLIIYIAFMNKKLVKFSIPFFIIAFIILSASLIGLLTLENQPSYLLVFTIRRFLIHPVFLLLLLPVFYFIRKNGD